MRDHVFSKLKRGVCDVAVAKVVGTAEISLGQEEYV